MTQILDVQTDLQMKIELTDDTPVAKNYVGVPRPFDRGVERICGGSSEQAFYPKIEVSIQQPLRGCKEKGWYHEIVY